jgi:hypothetical protein
MFKKIVLFSILSLIVLTLSNCKKESNPTVTTPIGTTVKLEVFAASGINIYSVQYYDAQQNSITLTNIGSNWTTTYQTTKDNQFITLLSNGGGGSVTGRIYINGVQKKEASGNLINIIYP